MFKLYPKILSFQVDPVLHKEFLAWKENPTTEQSDPFIARVYREDINSCLTFSNSQLATEVQAAVESDSIYVEAVNEKSKTHFPKYALFILMRQSKRIK